MIRWQPLGFGLRSLASLALLGAAASLPPAASAQAPENLRFFSADMTRAELIGIMRDFSFALGVRCTYCHEAPEDVPFEERDFASDVKPPKERARAMLRMVEEINGTHLAALPDRGTPGLAVSCMTCHGGVARPEQIDRLIERVVVEDGVTAAVARYRELRERYYGSAAYDFREQPLVELGTRLARGGDDDAARTILELNLEFLPESGQSMLGLAQLLERAGEVEEALSWYERSLEIFPDNPQVLERIRRLRGG